MPDVRDGETYENYMNRCIPIVKREDSGKGYDPKHAVAKCNGMWEQAHKAKKARKELNK